MTTPQDDRLDAQDVDNGHPSYERLSFEEWVRQAGFPVYGLIGQTDRPLLTGIGETTIPLDVSQAGTVAEPDYPRILWKISLNYSISANWKGANPNIELYTTNPHHALLPKTGTPVHTGGTSTISGHFSTPKDVLRIPQLPSHFTIERLPLLDQIVVATFDYAPHFPVVGQLMGIQAHHLDEGELGAETGAREILASLPDTSTTPRTTDPHWSFSLMAPNLLVEGAAAGWSATDLFALLARVGVLNTRPDDLAEQQQELLAARAARRQE